MEEKEKGNELNQSAVPPTDGGEVSAPVADAAAEGGQSARDRYRSRIASDYPDLNMDDEEAYYNAANERYDELGRYRESTENFRNALNLDANASGAFNRMIVAATEQKDFDPIVWLVENAGLDIAALMENEDYAKKIGDAHQKYLADKSKEEDLETQFAENAPASLDAIDQKAQEMGLDDAAKDEVIKQMYDLVDNMMVGIIPVDVFELLAKGNSHDTDVESAKEEGEARGRQTKITDKVRKLNKQPTVRGRQGATAGVAPKTDNEGNMFGL
jgi:tetratricopeptide (TPR) repeat protein